MNRTSLTPTHLKRLARHWYMALLNPPWNHPEAQAYEWRHAHRWSQTHADWVERMKRGEIPCATDEFFDHNPEILAAFEKHVRGKTILDVGCGPCPWAYHFPMAYRRILLDPLLHEYDRMVGIPKEIFQLNRPAEDWVPALENAVDGAIICRNALDHLADPYHVLGNLAAYAATGCYLLLWSDLWHLAGRDAGHRNITQDVKGFERVIQSLGFRIIRRVPPKRERQTIHYGCMAIKL